MKKGKRMEKVMDFLAGKGFYIVLFACILAIGISGYALIFAGTPTLPDVPTLDSLDNPLTSPDSVYTWDIPSPNRPAWMDETDPTIDFPAVNPDEGDAQEVLAPASPTVSPPAQSTVTPQPTPKTSTKPSATPKPSKKPVSFSWPVAGTVLHPFSMEALVFNATLGDWRVHAGLDIETAAGAKVSAMADGTVADIYEDPFLGHTIVISHDDDMRSVYCNLQKSMTVAVGDKVKMGDTLGAVSDSALSEASEPYHLHLEVYNGDELIDPQSVLPVR